MNTDRFLTRVFDTQEKKMLYPGAGFSYNNELFIFRGITDRGIQYTKEHRSGTNLISTFYILPFYETKDRFVPMMCLGNTDKNKKLIYSADIVATRYNKYLVYREEESAAFWFKRLDNECEILLNDFGCEMEIIGNRWEQPKLLEVKA